MNRKVGFFKSIQFKLIIIYVLLILIATQIIGVYFVRQLEVQLVTNYYKTIDERAGLLAYNIEQEMRKKREDPATLGQDIDLLLREFFDIENAEVQVIDQNKVILSTSNTQKRYVIGQQSTEVRVKRALLGTKDGVILRDPNTGQRMRVIALPVKSGDETIGALYIKASMEEIYEQMQQINNIFASGTLLSILITAILVILLARPITTPIKDMRKQAQRMAKGDFSQQVRVYSHDEIGLLAHAFNDLTKKLKEANALTEREKRKLSSVLTHMTDGVIATDQYGKVILMNKGAEQLLGMTDEEAFGRSLLEILPLNEDNTFYELYDYSESVLVDLSDEKRDFIMNVNFSVIQKENGQVNGLIAVLHDVTEQEKIDEERREFVANVSHELRTPLTTMKSYLEALEDGAIYDEQLATKFLKVTQTETERMIRLVNDLLQLSRIDSKDYQLSFSTVDFNQMIHQIIDRFEMLSKDKRVRFIRKIPHYPTHVEIDRDRMTQVIDNILSNALKYSPENGKITVTLVHQGHNIRLSIADEGVGIPRESQAKIFERFYRIDKARTRAVGGTGLGLAIAKELVHAHGGEIWVQSEEEKGTTIFFTLPYSTFKGGGVS